MRARAAALVALVGGVLGGGLALATATGVSAAAAPGLVVGKPFSLLLGNDLERVALGSDGTAWVAAALGYETDPEFAVVARSASRHSIRPANVSHAELPSVAVSGSTVMFVWYTVAGGVVAPGHPEPVTLAAMRCTPSGCGPIKTLARWQEINAPPQQNNVSVGYPPQPAVVAAGGQFVVLFEPLSAHEAMDWVQTDGSRFGPVHSFGTAGEPYPVAAAQADGSVIAAWPGPFRSPGIEWSRWSPRGGFAAPQRLAGTQHFMADLVAAGDGSGVALAWLQGPSDCDGAPGQYTCPVWAALPAGGGGVGPATLVYSPGAGQLSLAGGAGVFALAFARTTISGYADSAQGTYLERSVNGKPFSPPVDLDADGGPYPAVALDSHGDALVAWKHEPPPPNSSNTTVRLALVPPTGRASTPTTLGPEAFDDSPLIASTPSQTLVTWQRTVATGVLATP